MNCTVVAGRFARRTSVGRFAACRPGRRGPNAPGGGQAGRCLFRQVPSAKGPEAKGCLLRAGDRLAICGDSITEQKMYSRIMETYLTVCVPELKITVRQYGWSGETAERFLRRMTTDCLRFSPTVATTCYGMNDYRYRPYDEAIASVLREIHRCGRAFKAAGIRVVLGSPGCVGKVASWVKTAAGTLEEHNLHLCRLRDIDIDIAARENVRFADVFWPMFTRRLCREAEVRPGLRHARPRRRASRLGRPPRHGLRVSQGDGTRRRYRHAGGRSRKKLGHGHRGTRDRFVPGRRAHGHQPPLSVLCHRRDEQRQLASARA